MFIIIYHSVVKLIYSAFELVIFSHELLKLSI